MYFISFYYAFISLTCQSIPFKIEVVFELENIFRRKQVLTYESYIPIRIY